jgi:hypothetical protein
VPAILASTLAGAPPASANDSCNYYKWRAHERRWERVAFMVDSTTWEQGRTKGVDWDCPYCVTLPIPKSPDDGIPEEVTGTGEHTSTLVRATEPARDLVAQVLAITGVGDEVPEPPALDVNPLGDPPPPACPRAAPPEHDVLIHQVYDLGGL